VRRSPIPPVFAILSLVTMAGCSAFSGDGLALNPPTPGLVTVAPPLIGQQMDELESDKRARTITLEQYETRKVELEKQLSAQ
jgi:hypothetical protein